jgi:hypothetical protein
MAPIVASTGAKRQLEKLFQSCTACLSMQR